MSPINDSSASVPNGNSEWNEYVMSEQELQRLLTRAIDEKMVEGEHKTKSKSSASIYRVPEQLRKLNESAYTPRFVSIGPLHSKDQHILKSPVLDIKKSYANSLFARVSNRSEDRKATVLMECVGRMTESLDGAKKHYVENVEEMMDAEMLVIDGCFILELLYRVHHMEINDSSDPIFSSILMPVSIGHDLLLLENQLPFFVLHNLFDLTVARIVRSTEDPIPTLNEYIISCFSNMWNSEKSGTTTTPSPRNNNYHHILHILHSHYSPDHAVATFDDLSEFMPCASDLEYAGVKFVVGKKVWFGKPEGPFLSKFFHKAHFEIPTLRLYDSTEPLLRNLIAFEQCCHGDGVKRYFTSYAVLMDTLINTPKDVQVLEKAEIINNHLGASEDASHLFNNLCKGIVHGEFYFDQTISAAADYSNRCWPNSMAHLTRNYFATPWTTIAFCAAFITFGVTIFKFIRGGFH